MPVDTGDGTKVDSLLYAGNNLDKAREVFHSAIRRRPPIIVFALLDR